MEVYSRHLQTAMLLYDRGTFLSNKPHMPRLRPQGSWPSAPGGAS